MSISVFTENWVAVGAKKRWQPRLKVHPLEVRLELKEASLHELCSPLGRGEMTKQL